MMDDARISVMCDLRALVKYIASILHYIIKNNETRSENICDWICKKRSYMHNYKYLEILF